MKNPIIEEFESRFISKKVTHPKFRPGDSVRVHYKLEEESSSKKKNEKKSRIQAFEGVCIRYKKGSASANFTVRKIASNSVGVERIFPLHSPFVTKIDVLAAGKVNQSRLFYLRDLKGKSARIKTRRHAANTQLSTIIEGEETKVKKNKKKSAKA